MEMGIRLFGHFLKALAVTVALPSQHNRHRLVGFHDRPYWFCFAIAMTRRSG